MTDATYLDSSGSMYGLDLTPHAKGSVFYFDMKIHDKKLPFGEGTMGTDYGAVFRHARENGFQDIRIVTDGYADDYRTQPYGLSVEWVEVR